MRSILIGVPQTYPPPRVNGIVVGDFLASDDAPDLTQPQPFRDRLDRLAGGRYQIDVRQFRTDDKGALEAEILSMPTVGDVHKRVTLRVVLIEELLCEVSEVNAW